MRISESLKALFGKGAERKAVTLTDPLAADIFGTMPSIAGPTIGPATAIRVPAVYSAIALVTGAIGSLPAKVFAVDDGGKQAAIHHPAYALVHDWANDWTSAGELRAALTADALLHDAGYAYANRNGEGQVVEFIRLDPLSITAKQDETTGEPFYAQRQSNGRERTFRYQDILRISAPLGISPIKAGKEAIGLASVLERHGAQLFARGARPSAVLSKEGKAGNEGGATVIGRIKAAWRAWQSEASGDPLFLDDGWVYTPVTMTSTDAQFLENRRFAIEEIARLFRVPPHLLFELSRATWSNAEEMFQSFLTLTLRSWLDEWEAAYARVLLTPEERAAGLYIEFVIDDLLTANAATRATTYAQYRSMGAMTANEVRAGLNMPRMDGGDTLDNPNITPASRTGANDNGIASKDAAA
ncbi:MAG: phage portal protein [Mesorhizobium sp.]|nr:phage portal protein [Mesorhizobium sp.]MCO5163543.1 phage portal protein [Mesorhizobium sp.]